MLKTTTKVYALIAAAGVALCGSAAQAETINDTDVTLTVQNAITFAETHPISFGIWVVQADVAAQTDQATLTLTAAASPTITPAGATANAKFIEVDDSTADSGEFAISGAVPATQLTVTISDLQNLTCTLCGGGNPPILLTSVTPDDATPTTSGTGTYTLYTGAVLTTDISGTTQYADGAYAGSYDITVAY